MGTPPIALQEEKTLCSLSVIALLDIEGGRRGLQEGVGRSKQTGREVLEEVCENRRTHSCVRLAPPATQQKSDIFTDILQHF